VLKLFRSAKDAVLDIEQDPGTWNKMFLSGPYVTAIIVYMVYTFLLLLLGCYSIYVSVLDDAFKFDLRNAIFVCGFIGTVVALMANGMPLFTLMTETLNYVQAMMNDLAFHMLLILWSTLLCKVDNDKIVYLFQAAVVLTEVFVMTCKTFAFAFIFREKPMWWKAQQETMFGIVLPSAQAIVAFAFLGYAVWFNEKKKSLRHLSEVIIAAFRRLTLLAASGFLCYLLLTVINSKFFRDRNHLAGWHAAVHLLYLFAISIRSTALICVVLVRMHATSDREWTWAEVQLSKLAKKLSTRLSSLDGEAGRGLTK